MNKVKKPANQELEELKQSIQEIKETLDKQSQAIEQLQMSTSGNIDSIRTITRIIQKNQQVINDMLNIEDEMHSS